METLQIPKMGPPKIPFWEIQFCLRFSGFPAAGPPRDEFEIRNDLPLGRYQRKTTQKRKSGPTRFEVHNDNIFQTTYIVVNSHQGNWKLSKYPKWDPPKSHFGKFSFASDFPDFPPLGPRGMNLRYATTSLWDGIKGKQHKKENRARPDLRYTTIIFSRRPTLWLTDCG